MVVFVGTYESFIDHVSRSEPEGWTNRRPGDIRCAGARYVFFNGLGRQLIGLNGPAELAEGPGARPAVIEAARAHISIINATQPSTDRDSRAVDG